LRGQLGAAIKKIWSGRLLRRGVTAIYVVDAHTGEELYSVHADDKLNPASNVKLISTATVLDTLGPGWRYATRLFGAAPGGDGVSHGDLYLRGNSDPTFGTKRLRELVGALKASGVRKIEGDVVLSADAIRDTLGLPRVVVTVKAGNHANQPPSVEVSPTNDFIRLEVTATTTTARRARMDVKTRIEEDPAAGTTHLVVSVTGKIKSGKKYTYRRGVGRRSTFTGYAVRQFLREEGVEVAGTVRVEEFDAYVAKASAAGYLPVELARSDSAPVGELVSTINKRSLNYLADRLVMTAGAMRHGGPPSMQKAITAMHEWLESAGVNPHALLIDTGSGLSYQTQLTARQIVKGLRVGTGFSPRADSTSICEYAPVYHDSLSVAGVDGTLRGRMRSPEIRGSVLGKTGTLTGVIALAGIISAGDTNALAFSIVTNGNRHRNRYKIRREHDAIVRKLHHFLTARAERTPKTPVAVETATAKTAAAAAVAREDAGEGEAEAADETAETAEATEATEATDGGEESVEPGQ
jgi:D-alanyl-D-alanine carboxypeptidase/D-alanyl-D-alanine-endopeptidase (penicillin-binding protein 4)